MSNGPEENDAAICEGNTVLELGARGTVAGAPFVLAGRTCVRSDGGGQWNEWVLAFDDGRRGYLAEALGAFAIFFERPLAPPYESLVVGGTLGTALVVAARGQATRVARWGDAPESPPRYRYAELRPGGAAATIDYGDGAHETAVFVGRRITLMELGLRPRAERPHFLAAPGGDPPEGLELWLDIGDEGDLPASREQGAPQARFRVIGIVHRSAEIEGARHTWEEYVLHAPEEGLRWLVVADGHWNLVESVDPGSVEEISHASAMFLGETYRAVSSGGVRVEWASGELPWLTTVGAVTSWRDYVCGANVLSCESTDDEIAWSVGVYTPTNVIAGAFSKRLLPKPVGIAPNQPKPQK